MQQCLTDTAGGRLPMIQVARQEGGGGGVEWGALRVGRPSDVNCPTPYSFPSPASSLISFQKAGKIQNTGALQGREKGGGERGWGKGVGTGRVSYQAPSSEVTKREPRV